MKWYDPACGYCLFCDCLVFTNAINNAMALEQSSVMKLLLTSLFLSTGRRRYNFLPPDD